MNLCSFTNSISAKENTIIKFNSNSRNAEIIADNDVSNGGVAILNGGGANLNGGVAHLTDGVPHFNGGVATYGCILGVENIIADVLSRLPFASGEQTPRGAAFHEEIKPIGEQLRGRSSTFKQIGEHLRGRSCDFKHVNSTRNSTRDKPPTSVSSTAAHQSSTRLECERNSALTAPVERSCARSSTKLQRRIRNRRFRPEVRGRRLLRMIVQLLQARK